MRLRRTRGGVVALALAMAACSSRSLDDYESGSGGTAGATGGGGTGNVGGAGGSGGTTNVGGTAGAAGGGGGGNTGGTGGNTGGTGGSTGGTGGSTGGTGGSTGGTGGSTGGTGGSTGGTGGSTGGTGGSTGGTGGSTGGTGGSTGGTGGTGTTPVCGNSKLETGEECDDGGKQSGDGCDATCHVACGDVASGAKSYTASGRVHCYWAIVGSNNWSDSQDKCQNAYNKTGHLVSITSSGENAFVATSFASSSAVWIGGTDGLARSSSGTGTYKWVNNESIGYANYATNEPDNASCGTGCYEHRLAMVVGGKWEDQDDAQSHVGVCEWEPPP